MTRLLLGPIVRAGAHGEVSVWVETSDACSVSVLGARASTFCIGGHHYGIVDVANVPFDQEVGYTVELDDRSVWPETALGLPESRFVLWSSGPFMIAGGSCRQQAPRPLSEEATSALELDPLGADALAALSALIQSGRRDLPHLLLLTGDQVYADEQHESVVEALRTRRGRLPEPGRPEVTSFEEYTWLYQRTWSDPQIRWILSSVPSLMVFDDHDIIDDWNISQRWADDMAEVDWWSERLTAGIMAYWVYQHLGNMTAADRASDSLFAAISAADDGEAVLREFAAAVGTGEDLRLAHSWSFRYRGGPPTLVVLDTRNARVLDEDQRSMLSDTDWEMLEAAVADADEHLLIVSSVPWIMPPSVHTLEQWVSRLTRSSWRPVRYVAERVRRGVDLEHWPAFGRSFEDLRRLLAQRVAAPGTRSQVVLSGDVHFAYIAEASLGDGEGTGRAHQVVSSPLRHASANYEGVALRAIVRPPLRAIMRWATSLHRGVDSDIPFTITDGVWHDNNLATLTYDGHRVVARLDRAVVDSTGAATLEVLVERDL